ncbi:hypothetical protein XMM379_001664 [Aliiroseovarius sp. xm-m-379]|uniref:hypothetical protein n=2 Tax=Paracoccaceae TaxID=31989 RepID=UPI00156997C9|nr:MULTISPECIES: hypothetical protein [Aliiroseovarius]NRP13654.1 hypothetical protein [Aliiroseovarius sp. xm-d-517]NRP31505.1 hypothetical protein [Aliiroseovarius sp. xm-m-314]NRP33773.1 hypothetical protein [Aliiroseovarius sp. xm-a-104]NRP45261.1 hypothetical protein [Aliiroseovarius sp. xm-m-378]NRP50451.1 hypothetical protein [Aliiroseovarius sp. xm-m-354]NRP62301.1 hypothetical protein [Aliiroseovarius sp. xm-a-151]NRP81147.1 hypothetical protein [Aliiroseovarius sp. xm-v-209]NRQ052
MDLTHRQFKDMQTLIRFLKQERAQVASFADFRARLRNYGYCIRCDEGEHFVHALPTLQKVCPVPQDLFG